MSDYKIYIIEDDEVIAAHVCRQLQGWGYDVSIASDFRHILDEFVRLSPQLVILDISLPFYNGFHWCTEIRRISKVPILFLSSASDGMNQVMAMNMGGDDFVCKPFEMPVLAAKVQALLRRTYDFNTPQLIMKAGGVIFNPAEGTLRAGSEEISLTKNEMKMMQLLFENRGSVVTRDALMQRLWDSDEFVDENTLTVNMTRLRRKLSDIDVHDLIRTKKGMGYIIEEKL
jgi:DNA-binding response OmpR family regulator